MPRGDQVGVGPGALPGQGMGIHDHSSDPLGGLLKPSTCFVDPLPGFFGDGREGDYIFDTGSPTFLTGHERWFRNLTIKAGFSLSAPRVKIRVFDTLYMEANTEIHANGGDGNPGIGGLGGAPGIMAQGGLDTGDCKIPGSFSGLSGGGDGGGVGVVTALGGQVNTGYGFGFAPSKLYIGQKGAGGGGYGAAPQPGQPSRLDLWGPGSGVGGPSVGILGANLGGGSGGASGWLLEIYANKIVGVGTPYYFNSKGGKGGDGEVLGAAKAGNGGGGPGGVVRIFYRLISGFLWTILVTGGSPGIAGNGGGAGGDGFACNAQEPF